MTEISIKDVSSVVLALSQRLDAELRRMSAEELKNEWDYSWEATTTMDWNIYQFYTRLRSYEVRCRRWEELHGGSCCVVERVRDRYLIPRITDFAALLRREGMK